MPTKSFEDLKLNRQLLNAVTEAGYDQPTDIQQKAIPRILNGHDVMGIAQTGTGKTAAFVLPILMKIKYAQDNDALERMVGEESFEGNWSKFSIHSDGNYAGGILNLL